LITPYSRHGRRKFVRSACIIPARRFICVGHYFSLTGAKFMSNPLAATLNLMRTELKKLEQREAALKSELAEIQTAANAIRKVIKGAQKDATSVDNG
jgi:hypothetical protein